MSAQLEADAAAWRAQVGTECVVLGDHLVVDVTSGTPCHDGWEWSRGTQAPWHSDTAWAAGPRYVRRLAPPIPKPGEWRESDGGIPCMALAVVGGRVVHGSVGHGGAGGYGGSVSIDVWHGFTPCDPDPRWVES